MIISFHYFFTYSILFLPIIPLLLIISSQRITSHSAARDEPVPSAASFADEDTGSSRVGCNALLGASSTMISFNIVMKHEISLIILGFHLSFPFIDIQVIEFYFVVRYYLILTI